MFVCYCNCFSPCYLYKMIIPGTGTHICLRWVEPPCSILQTGPQICCRKLVPYVYIIYICTQDTQAYQWNHWICSCEFFLNHPIWWVYHLQVVSTFWIVHQNGQIQSSPLFALSSNKNQVLLVPRFWQFLVSQDQQKNPGTLASTLWLPGAWMVRIPTGRSSGQVP